jgi:hypothetical protein
MKPGNVTEKQYRITPKEYGNTPSPSGDQPDYSSFLPCQAVREGEITQAIPKEALFGEPDHDGTREFTHLWQLIHGEYHPEVFASTTYEQVLRG